MDLLLFFALILLFFYRPRRNRWVKVKISPTIRKMLKTSEGREKVRKMIIGGKQ